MSYNTLEYNQANYHSDAPLETSESSDVFQFDGYGLQNTDIITSEINFSTAPERDFELGAYPRARGQLLIDEQWRARTITLKGIIKADTAAELEQLIDEMKKRLAVRNGNLDILRTGWTATRRFVATLKSPEKLFAKRQRYHITICPFEAEFLCNDPYGYEIDWTSADLFNRTAVTVNNTVTNAGTAQSELVMYITINSMTSFTSLTAQNATTGEQIKITSSLVAGDVIIIDSVNKQVTLNGSAINFDGQFINLNAGDNNIQIDVASSAHDYDVTYKHKNAYL